MARDRFYGSQPWRLVRAVILDRDRYECQIKGVDCLGKATVVDHIVPRADAPQLSLDPANLRAACHVCNGNRAARTKAEEGWRRSPTQITLVWGPPCGGKSTYVTEHKNSGDLVIDFDLIASALGAASSHDLTNPAMRHAAALARSAVIRMLRRGEEPGFAAAWIISHATDATNQFPHHTAVLCDPTEPVALQRANQRTHPDITTLSIRRWYRTVGTTTGTSSRNWSTPPR